MAESFKVPQSIQSLVPTLQAHSLKILGALGVLFVGWLVALIVAGLVRKALARAKVEKIVGRVTFFDDMGKTIPVERLVSRAVFYLLMIFVFVGFFEALGLQIINEPLNRFLARIFDYAPRLIPPIVLILVAWVTATILKFCVVQVMGNTKLNKLLTEKFGLEREMQGSFIRTLANTVYWVVFLIFSLGVLDTLQLQGLLAPLQNMIKNVLAFLPNIFGAGIIFAVGWFLAKVVQRIVANLLVTVGTDRLSEKAGLGQILGRQSLANLIGLVAHIVVLVPVLIASLNALKLDSITDPASQMLNRFLTALPSIFASVVVLFIAFLIGRLVSNLVTNLLSSGGFDNVLANLGLSKTSKDWNSLLAKIGVGEPVEENRKTPSEIVGSLLLVGIVLFASIEALNLIGFISLANLLTQFTIFGGQVLLGLFIFAMGLFISNIAVKSVLSSNTVQAHLFALLTRISIMGLSLAMALRQMGLANEIITLAFGLILGAIAVAVAIAFGVGGRDVAAQILRDVMKNMRDNQRGPQI